VTETFVPRSNADTLVLVVEDHVLTMKLFRALIGARGYGTLQAPDGATGLALAREHQPDLIIMDVALPDVSGLDLTRELKDDERTRAIPIIVTTGAPMRAEDAEVWESGCDAFLAKPIAISDLFDVIDKCLAVPAE